MEALNMAASNVELEEKYAGVKEEIRQKHMRKQKEQVIIVE